MCFNSADSVNSADFVINYADHADFADFADFVIFVADFVNLSSSLSDTYKINS